MMNDNWKCFLIVNGRNEFDSVLNIENREESVVIYNNVDVSSI